MKTKSEQKENFKQESFPKIAYTREFNTPEECSQVGREMKAFIKIWLAYILENMYILTLYKEINEVVSGMGNPILKREEIPVFIKTLREEAALELDSIPENKRLCRLELTDVWL